MMGAGKSAVGRALAANLSLSFKDTDRLIENRAGCRIGEIFDRKGEAFFRTLESEVIAELSKVAGGVVALGGGAAVQPGAVDRLEQSGTLVYLRARPETLLERIGNGDSRPLLRGLDRGARIERITALQRERGSSYARARIVLDTDGKTIAEIAGEIEERIANLDRATAEPANR